MSSGDLDAWQRAEFSRLCGVIRRLRHGFYHDGNYVRERRPITQREKEYNAADINAYLKEVDDIRTLFASEVERQDRALNSHGALWGCAEPPRAGGLCYRMGPLSLELQTDIFMVDYIRGFMRGLETAYSGRTTRKSRIEGISRYIRSLDKEAAPAAAVAGTTGTAAAAATNATQTVLAAVVTQTEGTTINQRITTAEGIVQANAETGGKGDQKLTQDWEGHCQRSEQAWEQGDQGAASKSTEITELWSDTLQKKASDSFSRSAGGSADVDSLGRPASAEPGHHQRGAAVPTWTRLRPTDAHGVSCSLLPRATAATAIMMKDRISLNSAWLLNSDDKKDARPHIATTRVRAKGEHRGQQRPTIGEAAGRENQRQRVKDVTIEFLKRNTGTTCPDGMQPRRSGDTHREAALRIGTDRLDRDKQQDNSRICTPDHLAAESSDQAKWSTREIEPRKGGSCGRGRYQSRLLAGDQNRVLLRCTERSQTWCQAKFQKSLPDGRPGPIDHGGVAVAAIAGGEADSGVAMLSGRANYRIGSYIN